MPPLLESVLEVARDALTSTVGAALTKYDAYRQDGWTNVMTGMGTSRDKTTGGFFRAGCDLSDQTLSNLYTYDDLSATIVDTYPQEELRLGFGLKGLSPESATKVDRYLKKFKIVDHVLAARIWGRLYGGAVIWVMVDDGLDPSEPLDPESVRSVLGLRVVDRRWAIPVSWYLDGPEIGLTETYRIQQPHTGGVGATLGIIHETRMIRFPGERTETIEKLRRIGWDMSVLVKPYEALRQAGETWKAIELLVTDANQGVYEVEDLYGKIAGDVAQGDPSDQNPTGGGSFLKRVQIMDRIKSVFRAIVLDKDKESYTRLAQTFTGLPDLSDRAWGRVAAASKIPVPLLRGENPAGLNATGTMQLTWFWAKVDQNRTQIDEPLILAMLKILLSADDAPPVELDEADSAEAAGQESDLGKAKPKAPKADELIAGQNLLSNTGDLSGSASDEPEGDGDLEDNPIDKIGIVWLPLWAPTAVELADIRLKRAQEAQVYINAQGLLPEEVMLSLPEEWWPAMDRDLRKQSLKDDAETMLKQKNEQKIAQGAAAIDLANNPPPQPPPGGGFPPKPGQAPPPKGPAK